MMVNLSHSGKKKSLIYITSFRVVVFCGIRRPARTGRRLLLWKWSKSNSIKRTREEKGSDGTFPKRCIFEHLRRRPTVHSFIHFLCVLWSCVAISAWYNNFTAGIQICILIFFIQPLILGEINSVKKLCVMNAAITRVTHRFRNKNHHENCTLTICARISVQIRLIYNNGTETAKYIYTYI